eukprot:jgi/Ulvmu1/3003/UM015_0043.1
MLTATSAVAPAQPKSGLLHSVRASQYAGLTAPAARIMAEASSMYAWIDDTVPHQFREDASWRLARFRMPSVAEHLRVVLRSREPMQLDAVHAELQELKSVPSKIDYPNIHQQPLEVGLFEVVAIYSLIPPSSEAKQEATGSVLQAMVQAVMSVPRMLVSLFWRLVIYSQMAHYGWGSLMKMRAWVKGLNIASEVCELTDLHDSSNFKLQTMSVARHRQRQGLGSSVMDLVKQDVIDAQGSGMEGLCQSDATRLFYEKQGFASRDVYTHPPSDLLHDGIRKHFLVAWDAKNSKQD